MILENGNMVERDRAILLKASRLTHVAVLAIMLVILAAPDASSKARVPIAGHTKPGTTSAENPIPIYEYQRLMESTTNEATAGEKIPWQVLSGGGLLNGASASYIHSGAVGQTAVGLGQANDLILVSGFWQTAPDGNMSCCDVPGDANDDGSADVGDAVFIISNVFKGGPDPNCLEKGDANSDCNINVGDAVFLINMCFSEGRLPTCNCNQ